jgi:rhodanese-related sulfurtransferase
MNSKTILWIVIAILAVGAVYFALQPAGGGIRNVDAAGVREAQQAGARVIDVRTAAEYAGGHVPGAENVPLDQIGQAAATWDKNAKYVVYCQTGSRSSAAVEQLKALGFGNVDHFNAGIIAWDGEFENASTPPAGSSEPTPSGLGAGDAAPAKGSKLIEFYTDS